MLKENERISVIELNQMVAQDCPLLLIDVRRKVEYDMCHLPFTINIQLGDLKNEETQNELIKQINSCFEGLVPNCKYNLL